MDKSPNHLARIISPGALCLATLLVLATSAWQAPVSAQVAVSGDLVREHAASPGRRYSGSIRVRNASSSPQDVEVSTADYHFDADGSSRFEKPGSLPRSLASWITYAPARITLAPGAETDIAYTVQVPSTAGVGPDNNLTGSYWTALVIEGASVAAGEMDLAQRGVGLVPRVRYAVQIAAHIDPAQDREIDLSNIQVERTDAGSGMLSIDARNTGQLGYRPTFELQVFDAVGELVGRYRQERGLLLPGTGIRQRFELGALAPGAYELFMTIDTGAADLLGTQFRIEL